jgi:hypothetical protein
MCRQEKNVANQMSVFTNVAYMGDPAEKLRAGGWQSEGGGVATRNGGLNIERVRGYGDDTILCGSPRCGIGSAGWKDIRRRTWPRDGG